jgi:hypothetical protein
MARKRKNPKKRVAAEDDGLNIQNVYQCALAVARLYEAVEGAHGEAAARRMFALYGNNLTPRQIAERKNAELMLALVHMPKPNKQKLAVDLARKNETLPREKRYGPRGSTSPATMLKQIERVLKQKEWPGYSHKWARHVLSYTSQPFPPDIAVEGDESNVAPRRRGV